MNFRPVLLLAIAASLVFVSHRLELRGDLAPFAEHGVSSARAMYHGTALLLLVGAIGCFIAAGVTALRRRLR